MDTREKEWRTRVEAALRSLRERVDAQAKELASLKAKPHSKGTAAGSVATDADLDGRYGDPEVKRDPPRWDGESFKGRRYSACSSAFLLDLANFLDWKAGKTEEEGDPGRLRFARYDRLDAARARGWAARIDAGQVAQDDPTDESGSEIPF
jgi:hypothetical protein